jgi:hypothetical protein
MERQIAHRRLSDVKTLALFVGLGTVIRQRQVGNVQQLNCLAKELILATLTGAMMFMDV